MNVREKLVELLKTNACPSPYMCDPACRYLCFEDCFPERFADHLISHGVTVQEWISVTDETKPKCPCLVIDVHGNLPRVAYQMLHYTSERFGYFCCDRDFEQMATDIYTKKKVGVDNAVMVAHGNRIAYWMPLPPLPKGE